MDIQQIPTNIWNAITDAWGVMVEFLNIRAFIAFIRSPFRFIGRRQPELIGFDHEHYVQDRIPYSNFDNGVGAPIWRWSWFGYTAYELRPHCPNCERIMRLLPCVPRSANAHIDDLKINPRDMQVPEIRLDVYMKFIRNHEPCEKNWLWCIECSNCIIERLPSHGRRSSGGGDLRAQDLIAFWTDQVREEIYRRASKAAAE